MTDRQIKELAAGDYVCIAYPRVIDFGRVKSVFLKKSASGEDQLNDYTATITVFGTSGKFHNQPNDIVIDSDSKWKMIIPAEIEKQFLELLKFTPDESAANAYGQTASIWFRTDDKMIDGVRMIRTWTLEHKAPEPGWTLTLDELIGDEPQPKMHWKNLGILSDIQRKISEIEA